ncbi:MAG: DUF1570 domain-containing protein [Tepidisphaeraceae bacterium]
MTRRSALTMLCFLLCGSTAFADLRTLNSRHYRIHTDLDRDLAEDLSRRLDAMHDEYARRLVDFSGEAVHPRYEVYLFRKREDYLKLIDNRLPNTGGVFIAGRNVLAAFLERQGRDAMRRTLQHEAFHQFAHLTISPDLPVWLNEGIAQLFEEGIWTGDRFLLGQVAPRRVRQLQADMKSKRLLRFEAFLNLTHDDWGEALKEPNSPRGASQYNQAWAMVHFLVYGGEGLPPVNGLTYRQRLIAMLKLLHDGRTGASAFKEAFSDNYAGFEGRFVEWARALKATPEASMIERQEVLADLLISLSGKGKTFADIASFREAVLNGGYKLRYSKGDVQWQTEPDMRLYFSDLAGRAFNPEELFFEIRGGSGQLPDIVCRCDGRLQLRTRFHASGQKTEREVLVEPGK